MFWVPKLCVPKNIMEGRKTPNIYWCGGAYFQLRLARRKWESMVTLGCRSDCQPLRTTPWSTSSKEPQSIPMGSLPRMGARHWVSVGDQRQFLLIRLRAPTTRFSVVGSRGGIQASVHAFPLRPSPLLQYDRSNQQCSETFK